MFYLYVWFGLDFRLWTSFASAPVASKQTWVANSKPKNHHLPTSTKVESFSLMHSAQIRPGDYAELPHPIYAYIFHIGLNFENSYADFANHHTISTLKTQGNAENAWDNGMLQLDHLGRFESQRHSTVSNSNSDSISQSHFYLITIKDDQISCFVLWTK